MNDDTISLTIFLCVMAGILILLYQGVIKDHPIKQYYISGQHITECGTKISIVGLQPWGLDKVVYKAETLDETVEKVKQLNSTLVKEEKD